MTERKDLKGHTERLKKKKMRKGYRRKRRCTGGEKMRQRGEVEGDEERIDACKEVERHDMTNKDGEGDEERVGAQRDGEA